MTTRISSTIWTLSDNYHICLNFFLNIGSFLEHLSRFSDTFLVTLDKTFNCYNETAPRQTYDEVCMYMHARECISFDIIWYRSRGNYFHCKTISRLLCREGLRKKVPRLLHSGACFIEVEIGKTEFIDGTLQQGFSSVTKTKN
jgi:hypothetical protein